MDGCSRLGALWRVIVPVAQPGVVATAIFCFISAWNEFLFALVLTTNQAKTITVKLAEMQGTMHGGMEITKIASGAVLGVLPVVLLVILLNRLIVRGLTEGAIKA
jgi:multiple sugar transport system permease protein